MYENFNEISEDDGFGDESHCDETLSKNPTKKKVKIERRSCEETLGE